MRALLQLADKMDIVTIKLGKAGGWLIIPLIILIMFDVITRKIAFLRIGMSELSWYWLIEPIKIQDMEWHLHGVLLLLSFGFAYLHNAHVRVDIFREKMSADNQARLEFWGLLIMAIPYICVLLYNSWIFVEISISQNEGSESLTGIPKRYIVKSFTIVGFSLALMAVTSTFIRLTAYLYGSKEAHDEATEKLQIFAIDDDHDGHQGHKSTRTPEAFS